MCKFVTKFALVRDRIFVTVSAPEASLFVLNVLFVCRVCSLLFKCMLYVCLLLVLCMFAVCYMYVIRNLHVCSLLSLCLFTVCCLFIHLLCSCLFCVFALNI